jgi:hypothetical protein
MRRYAIPTCSGSMGRLVALCALSLATLLSVAVTSAWG